MSAKKCPSCGKERCPGVRFTFDCPAFKATGARVGNVTTTVATNALRGDTIHVGDPEPPHPLAPSLSSYVPKPVTKERCPRDLLYGLKQ